MTWLQRGRGKAKGEIYTKQKIATGLKQKVHED